MPTIGADQARRGVGRLALVDAIDLDAELAVVELLDRPLTHAGVGTEHHILSSPLLRS